MSQTDNLKQAQPHELRLGNWIYDDEGKLSKIEALETLEFNSWNGSDGLFQIKRDDGQFYCDVVFGVPLTEDWLGKFGFEKLDTHDVFYILMYNLNLKISEDLKMVAWHNMMLHEVELRYVHQLQNLYHALTSQELTIQP